MNVDRIKGTLWTEKYRPTTIDDFVFFTALMKEQFHRFIAQQDFPHLLFTGPAGVGKTTMARILTTAIPCQVLELNASSGDRGIDTVRNDITSFCRGAIPKGKMFRVVFLDEADRITYEAQDALRNTIEAHSKTCRFILTANASNKIFSPIQSRCTVIEFVPSSQNSFFQRAANILCTESIKYENDVLLETVNLCYPDLRKLISAIQLDSYDGVLHKHKSTDYTTASLCNDLAAGRLAEIRTGIAGETDFLVYYKALFEWAANLNNVFPNIEQRDVVINSVVEHLHYNLTIPDRELNFTACCYKIMRGWGVIH